MEVDLYRSYIFSCMKLMTFRPNLATMSIGSSTEAQEAPSRPNNVKWPFKNKTHRDNSADIFKTLRSTTEDIFGGLVTSLPGLENLI